MISSWSAFFELGILAGLLFVGVQQLRLHRAFNEFQETQAALDLPRFAIKWFSGHADGWSFAVINEGKRAAAIVDATLRFENDPASPFGAILRRADPQDSGLEIKDILAEIHTFAHLPATGHVIAPGQMTFLNLDRAEQPEVVKKRLEADVRINVELSVVPSFGEPGIHKLI